MNVLLMLNSKWGLERYCEMVEAAGAPVEIPSLEELTLPERQ